MGMSVRSLSKSLKLEKVYKNDLYTNVALFVTIALAVNYINQKQYKTLVYLAVFGGAGFLLSKNLMYSLVFTIVVTNLLVSMKYVEGIDSTIDGETVKADSRNRTEDIPNVGQIKEKYKNIGKPISNEKSR